MKKLVESFKAKGTDGTIYTVQIFQTFRVFKPIDGPATEVGGTKEAVLSNGRHLNLVDDDTFQILDNDEIIRRL